MQKLLLFKPDLTPFDPMAVERAFRSCADFKDLRFDEPGGALLECQYTEPGAWSTIRLSGDASTISLSFAWGPAIRAALLIQKFLGVPLRMVTSDNSLDLTYSDISTAAELEAAMDNARRS